MMPMNIYFSLHVYEKQVRQKIQKTWNIAHADMKNHWSVWSVDQIIQSFYRAFFALHDVVSSVNA